MSREPITSDKTLRDAATMLAERYLADGTDVAALQVALDVDDGKRKLLVTIALRVDPVDDFSGMLPGQNP